MLKLSKTTSSQNYSTMIASGVLHKMFIQFLKILRNSFICSNEPACYWDAVFVARMFVLFSRERKIKKKSSIQKQG